MTTIEALNAVESELTALSLKDSWGDPVTGIEAFAVVAKEFFGPWDWIAKDFSEGKISPDQYAERTIGLIREYSKRRQSRTILRKLEDLKADQVELDLVGTR